MGTGAALLLIGWLGRDLGPRLRYRTPQSDDEVLAVEELVARVSWSRFCASGGAALALCGLFMLLVTLATLLLRVDDATGRTTMLVSFGFVVVAMAVWSWAYVRRFGVYGVLPPRRQRAASSEPVIADQPAIAVLDPAQEPTGPDDEPEPLAAATPETASEPELAAADVSPEQAETELIASSEDSSGTAEAATESSTADLAAEPTAEPASEPPSDPIVAESLPADPSTVVDDAPGPPAETLLAETEPSEPTIGAASDTAIESEVPSATSDQPVSDAVVAGAATERPSDESAPVLRPGRRRGTSQVHDYLARHRPQLGARRSARPADPATEGEP